MAMGFKIDDTFAILVDLRRNGFEIEIDEATSVGQESRLHFSGSTHFDMKGRPSEPSPL
jgi:hypothetical protein